MLLTLIICFDSCWYLKWNLDRCEHSELNSIFLSHLQQIPQTPELFITQHSQSEYCSYLYLEHWHFSFSSSCVFPLFLHLMSSTNMYGGAHMHAHV